jgi:hypothetical protein
MLPNRSTSTASRPRRQTSCLLRITFPLIRMQDEVTQVEDVRPVRLLQVRRRNQIWPFSLTPKRNRTPACASAAHAGSPRTTRHRCRATNRAAQNAPTATPLPIESADASVLMTADFAADVAALVKNGVHYLGKRRGPWPRARSDRPCRRPSGPRRIGASRTRSQNRLGRWGKFAS